MTTKERRRRGLTEISDTISDHDTLQVDLGLAMLLELEVPVRNSRSKERKVSTLKGGISSMVQKKREASLLHKILQPCGKPFL